MPRLGGAYVVTLPLHVSDATYSELESSLSAEERSRASCFLSDEVRRRFVVCRGRLRQTLGTLLGIAPHAVQFHYEQWGKPKLAGVQAAKSGEPLHFNVTHSGDWAAIAIAATPIGVDLEMLKPSFRHRSVAGQVLCKQELAAWEAVAARERDHEMLRLWVCKEALLKALGLGIAEGLQQIEFPLPIPTAASFHPQNIDSALQLHLDDDGTCRMTAWTDRASWRLQLLDLIPGGVAAIATWRSVTQFSCHSY
ncbi:4'-phosphopantetheinyl transferase family protein [Aureliella helgolandensis]|nr:4'-phosphopantetheinyl transferase superfamily protein [Aureliella helgolandensis]